ncbi:MAG: BCCT family transporter, partial [Nitriliruptor sp.]
MRLETNPSVFIPSVVVILLFLLVGVAATEQLGRVFETVQDAIASTLDWYYILTVTAFLAFVVWLGASRFGRMRLGGDDERPRYRYLTWFALLFTAGMGI